ncbi:unnamed protein product, partial [Ectocarpus sp. 8 AP-2014]
MLLLGRLSHGARLSSMEEDAPFSPTPTPPLPPPPEPLPLESKAMPSYNRELKSFAGEESNNNVPMEDPVFSPTLEADMDSAFSVFFHRARSGDDVWPCPGAAVASTRERNIEKQGWWSELAGE